MNGIEGVVKGGKEGLGKKKTKEEITLLGDIWGDYLFVRRIRVRQTERERDKAVNSAKYLKVLIE